MTTISREPESLEDALMDVETRFIYSFPESELNKTERLFFQIEQAYWYYEDFKADRFPTLPHFNHLKNFAKKIFEHCELLKNKSKQFKELFETYANYKSKIPVCGCILMNPSMNKVVLVCNWDGKSWSFPRGKIDENETEFNCAMREVNEETGFNPEPHCNENEFLVCFQDQKKIQLFIGVNVPEDTVFQSRTRKEISKIEFFDMTDLPKNTFLVHPFIPKLKRWVEKKQKSLAKQNNSFIKSPYLSALTGANQVGSKKILSTPTRNKESKNKEKDKDKDGNFASPKILKRRPAGPLIDAKNADTFALFPSIIASETAPNKSKDSKGWSVEEMFKANAKLTGKEYDYDGNPHSFGASHPKFVNYRNYTDLVKHLGSQNNKPVAPVPGGNFDLDFQTLSLQSQQLGEKFLRAGRRRIGEESGDEGGGSELESGIDEPHHERNDIEKEFDAFSLPTSEYYRNMKVNADGFDPSCGIAGHSFRKPTFFQLPFKLDTRDIMAAVDAQLLNFSFE